MKRKIAAVTLPPLIRDLIKPGILPDTSDHIELVQTQMSWVILCDKYVLKLKKAVNLGYVDYTSLENRRYYCNREVELNRRLCPAGYLGVIAIYCDKGRHNLDGRGEVVDYAVKMKRLPAGCMLDHHLVKGTATPEKMLAIADTVAAFHHRAETSEEIAVYGRLDAVNKNVCENFEQTAQYVGQVIDDDAYQATRRFSLEFLDRHSLLFEQRVKENRIKDCHGDLHAAHICLLDNICIYDCIEFNDRFRYGDTASEVAFLVMDLDHYGRADLAWYFGNRYVQQSGDTGLIGLLNFYKCYRAIVRAKVNCFKYDDPYVDRPEKLTARDTARQYFDLARSYTRSRPLLIVNVGLVGSGKSTMAGILARRMGMVVISSDIVRKTLAGIPPTEPRRQEVDSGIYSPQFSRLTYQAMFKQAELWLSRGLSVILDATFTLSSSRAEASRVAGCHNADLVFLEYRIDDKEACDRLEKRFSQADNVSDGRAEIYFKLKREFEPLDQNQAANRVIIDSTLTAEENLKNIQSFIYQK